ncbi:MAG: hypothetical protein N2444_00915 [Methylocystis sp.]|nr:hypothetical protein [Methylocystis sp.]
MPVDSSGQIAPAKLIFALVGFLALASVPLLISGPQLLADRAGKQWRPAPELQVKSADCDVWRHLVYACEIEYVDVKAPDAVRPSLHYLVYGVWARKNWP